MEISRARQENSSLAGIFRFLKKSWQKLLIGILFIKIFILDMLIKISILDKILFL